MGKSEIQTQIINLGKHFVSELKLDPGIDTLSKWMAHYIAEKITLLEHLKPDEDKRAIENECFETILKLWEHRWSLQPGKRPLESFEPILKTLERLNPDKQEPYFYSSIDHELSTLEKENPSLKDILNFTKMALQIDKTARIGITSLLHKAALKATDEKTEALLKNSVSLKDNNDTIVVRLVLGKKMPSLKIKKTEEEEDTYEEDDDDIVKEVIDEDFEKSYQVENLKMMIKQLEITSKINEYLLEGYKKDLSALS